MMNLSQIITALETPENTVLIESIIPYKKALLTYYSNAFCCEPVLMVTDVMNAAQYAKIVSCDEFSEEIEDYVNSLDLDSEEIEDEKELINFNSIMLSNL